MAKLLMTRRGQCWPQYRATPVRYIGGNTEFALKQQPWPAAWSIGRIGRGAPPRHGGGSARKSLPRRACVGLASRRAGRRLSDFRPGSKMNARWRTWDIA